MAPSGPAKRREGGICSTNLEDLKVGQDAFEAQSSGVCRFETTLHHAFTWPVLKTNLVGAESRTKLQDSPFQTLFLLGTR